MFDELLTPPPSVDHQAPEVFAPIAEVVAPEPAASTDSLSLTTVNQDAPLPSNSQTTTETQSSIIPGDVEDNNHDLDVAHMNNDPFFGIPIPEVSSDQSSSTDSNHTVMHPDHQILEHNIKWTKDHPLENIIGELARPVSTRLIMDSSKAQQMALDETLVAITNRLKIGKGNQRLSPDLKSNEATIQVVLDALKLTPGPRLKTQAKMKQPAKKTKAKGLTMLTEAAISEANHLKLGTKKGTKGFNISHASSSGDGVGKLSKVPDEQEQKDIGTDEGNSEEEGDDDDHGNNDDDGGNDDEGDDVIESDDEQIESENDDDGSGEEEDVEESAHTQSDEEKFDYEESNDDDESMNNEDDEEVKELYDNVNLNLGNTDAEITYADQGTTEQHVSQEEEDAHVTLTHVQDATKADEPLQSSSVSFNFTSKFLNLENSAPTNTEIASLMKTLAS
nr:hypothetical protein [Tanacetum cinerariifolium]